jgi:hypothetical protein
LPETRSTVLLLLLAWDREYCTVPVQPRVHCAAATGVAALESIKASVSAREVRKVIIEVLHRSAKD